jgi:cysteate synthase
MKLMVSQNKPFTPIHDAWKADSRHMLHLDDKHARKQVEEILAKVLSNRKPPYPIIGGLYDAMKDAGGDVLLADNDEAVAAAKLFEETEGNDIHPAASVAVATLINAVKEGVVKSDDLIMLNITGGGEERFHREKELVYLKPSLVFDLDPDPDFVKEKLQELYA